MENKPSYTLVHKDCGKKFTFSPTKGQLRALKGGAKVKVICPKCIIKIYWEDPGLKKLEKQSGN